MLFQSLIDESKDWIAIGGRLPDQTARTPRNGALLARFEARLPELLGPVGEP